jgi:CheY-like chemotaxis protein
MASTNKRILAVDDSLTVRKLVVMTLKQEGYEVTEAETGAEALTKATQLNPDMILMDHVLPDMRSTEVCQLLLKNQATRDIPVLLISSNGNAIRQLYHDVGNVADYLTKPFAANVLKAVVFHILKKNEPHHTEAGVSPEIRAASGNRVEEQASGEGVGTLFCCQSDFVSVDYALCYIEKKRVRGLFSIDLPEESIEAFVEEGKVVYIGSNNPCKYCKGAVFNFRDIPHQQLGVAVQTQQREGLPFFISLWRMHLMDQRSALNVALHSQGEATMARALSSISATYSFTTLQELPQHVVEFAQNYKLPQLLLAGYRTVDSWLNIETTIPGVDAMLTRHPQFEDYIHDLELKKSEKTVLEFIDGPITVQEIARLTKMDHFDMCRILYCFVKLGLLQVTAAPMPPDHRFDGAHENHNHGETPPPSTPFNQTAAPSSKAMAA